MRAFGPRHYPRMASRARAGSHVRLIAARHLSGVLGLAAISDSLVPVATHVVGDLGLIGIFVLMLLESACVPIPSEVTMLFAGFEVSQGRYSLLAITAAGVLGNLVGSWLAYAVGRFGRRVSADRPWRWLRVNPRHLAWAERWFARYGSAAVFFSRMLPLVRTFISLPAGMARLPLARFSALTAAGCVPWVLALGAVGEQLGRAWRSWHGGFQYVDYGLLAAAAVGVAVLLVRRPWERMR